MSFMEVCNSINNNFNVAFRDTDLSQFLLNFTDVFRIYSFDGQLFVKLTANLSICKTHCSRSESCFGDFDCTGLHICKFYLLEGKCNFGASCKYGHDLKTVHNKKILLEKRLSGVSLQDIRYLLNLPENKTIPKICRFYNNAEGCKQTARGNCSYLHICKYYLFGSCQYNKKCKRNHDIDDNVKTILQKHGLDTAKPVKDLLSELRVLCRTNNNVDDECEDTQAEPSLR